MSVRKTRWIPLALVVVALGAAAPAHADAKNQIRAVTVDESAGVASIKVRGSQTATFTVYKLERPTRVVIDVAQASLAEAVRGAHESSATWTPGTWAVSQVAAQEMSDGGALVRVVVTLARPGRWDVKAVGDDVIVSVTPRDAPPATDESARADLARAQGEAAQAKQDTASARADAARAKDAATAAQAEAARARAAQATAEAAVRDAQAARVDGAARQKMIDEARAEAARAKSAAEAAQAAAEAAKATATAQVANAQAAAASESAAAARAKEEAARATQAAAAETAAAKKATSVAQAEADQARRTAQAEAAKARQAQAVAAQAVAAQAEASARAAAQAEASARAAARTQAASQAQTQQLIDDARAEAARAKAAAAAAQAQAEQARKDADRIRQESSARAASTQAELDQARADAAKARGAAAEAQTAAERAVAAAHVELGKAQEQASAARDVQVRAQTAQQQAAEREAQALAAQQAAERERARAAAAAQSAQADRDRASQDAKARADRDAIVQAAADAERRLHRAEAAAKAADAERATAEAATAAARTDAARAQQSVADAEAKKRAAEIAAGTAEQTRATAEQRRGDAERGRAAAEQARAAADDQRKTAEAAAAAATARAESAAKARTAEEAAASAASQARALAEQRRDQAATAAAALETSIAAEQHAAQEARDQAAAADRAAAAASAAERRKAGQAVIDEARAEASRLEAARLDATRTLATKQAEVDRRQKAVADLDAARYGASADLARLKSAAAQAKAAREAEEQQLAALEARRTTAVRELARLEQARTRAQAVVAAAPVAPAPVATAPVAAKPVATAPVATAPVAAKPVAAAPVAARVAVKNVSFDHDADTSQVVIDLGGDVSPEIVSTTDRRAELILDGVDLPKRLERTLDTSRFSGPVKAVSAFRDPKTPNRVRVVVDLAAPAAPRLAHVGTTWRWQFAGAAATASRAPTSTARSIPTPVVAGYGASSTPVAQTSVAQVAGAVPSGKRKIYHGATMDLATKDASIHDLLSAISDVARVNIVIPDDINARVTVRLKRVPWDQALEVILASKGLWYRREGNLIRVAPRKQLDAEDEAEAARLAAERDREAPEPEVLTLNYASASELQNKLTPMLSPKGKIEVDDRTNSVIINDLRANRRRIQQLALQLDTQTPQISIEARIVEARSTYAREFGIQWGGSASASSQGGNATGLIFPSAIGLAGGADDKDTNRNGTATPSDFAVNLPAQGIGSDRGGALGMSLGSVGGNFNINLRLSALEDSGTVRIISAPRITVLNNTEAKISQGVRIPISVVSASGTQTQFVPAELSLVVKPYVSQRDCSIAMDLHVTKNEPDFVNVGARGDPTILSKEAQTRILIGDGDTTVLGGIYTRASGISYNKVPFLGDLPVFGWLFKHRKETDDRTELLIFVTPKITNKAFLRCQP